MCILGETVWVSISDACNPMLGTGVAEVFCIAVSHVVHVVQLALKRRQGNELDLWRQYKPCKCNGPCNDSCACFTSLNYCDKFCGCPPKCTLRFQGCKCSSGCKSKTCPCSAAGTLCPLACAFLPVLPSCPHKRIYLSLTCLGSAEGNRACNFDSSLPRTPGLAVSMQSVRLCSNGNWRVSFGGNRCSGMEVDQPVREGALLIRDGTLFPVSYHETLSSLLFIF